MAFNNGKKNDCTLVCEGKIFEVNRQLLAEGNIYFQAMFSSSMKESSNDAIHIYGISADSLDAILQYLNTKELPNLQPNEDFLLDLLSASHMFLIDELFEYCCHQLKNFLAETNFSDLWALAKFYDKNAFLEVIMDFVASNFFEVNKMIFKQITLKEIKLLLNIIRCRKTVPSEWVLKFLFSWIKDNIDERQKFLTELISLADMNSLAEEQFEFFLNHESLLQSSVNMTQLLTEKFCMHNLKLFVFSKNSFQSFSIHDHTWSDIKDLPFLINKYICFGFVNLNYFYLLFAKRTCNCLYRINKDGSSIYKCLTIDYKMHNEMVVYDGKLFVLRGFYSRYLQCWEYVVHAYDLHTTKFDEILNFTEEFCVNHFSCVHNNLIMMYRDRWNALRNIWKRYDILTREWSKMNVPPMPLDADSEEDYLVTCLGELFYISLEAEAKSVIWYEEQHIPTEEINLLKDLGPVEITKFQNRFHCRALYTNKLFFKYNMKLDQWTKIMSNEGPEIVQYVWEGPSSIHKRIPYIYIIGGDWYLYQYDPKENVWTTLCSIPNEGDCEMRQKKFTLGC